MIAQVSLGQNLRSVSKSSIRQFGDHVTIHFWQFQGNLVRGELLRSRDVSDVFKLGSYVNNRIVHNNVVLTTKG